MAPLWPIFPGRLGLGEGENADSARGRLLPKTSSGPMWRGLEMIRLLVQARGAPKGAVMLSVHPAILQGYEPQAAEDPLLGLRSERRITSSCKD